MTYFISLPENFLRFVDILNQPNTQFYIHLFHLFQNCRIYIYVIVECPTHIEKSSDKYSSPIRPSRQETHNFPTIYLIATETTLLPIYPGLQVYNICLFLPLAHKWQNHPQNSANIQLKYTFEMNIFVCNCVLGRWHSTSHRAIW